SRVAIENRTVVNLQLPLRAGRTEHFWFHTEGGGRRAANDPRIMNFAVFRCSWSDEPFAAPVKAHSNGAQHPRAGEQTNGSPKDEEHCFRNGKNWDSDQSSENGSAAALGGEGSAAPAANDIASAEMGLRFGSGWGALDEENGEPYRGVENGA